ncbi:MAG: hypothetical protein IJ202_05225 [Bacteroidales bacterium]|nr:hypothetical protein [Bacteroidales bacterium]
MKKDLFFVFLLSLASFFAIGCEKDTIFNFEPVPYGPHSDPPIISIEGVRKTGTAVLNGFMHEGIFRRSQGMAISDGVLYCLFTTGMCKTYDISDIDNPKPLGTFELGSYSDNNHANSAQFHIESNGEKYVYISGMGGRCFVEKITETSSTLVQTITLDEIDYLKKTKRVNMLCGDDGYMYLFGIDKHGDSLVFARVRRPDPTSGNATITKDDILDFWHNNDYYYYDSLAQGGKVYKGNLFFVFGSTTSDRHLDVYNIFTHEKVYSYNLNNAISEEPEDCDLVDGHIMVTVTGGRGYYLLKLKN